MKCSLGTIHVLTSYQVLTSLSIISLHMTGFNQTVQDIAYVKHTFLLSFMTLYILINRDLMMRMSLNWFFIGSGNGLSPVWYEVITWSNDDLLSIRHLGTYSNKISFAIQNVSFKKIHFNFWSARWWPFVEASISTHWGRDKMAAILHTTFLNASSWNKNIRISHKISLNFVLKVPINNIPALAQIMA